MIVRSDEANRAELSSEGLTVLVIAQVSLVRMALRQLLATVSEVGSVREAGAIDEAVALAIREQPAIALIDAAAMNGDIIAAVRRILAVAPETQLVILSDDGFSDYVVEAASAGVWGYIPRDVSQAELARAIRFVASGRVVVACSFHPKQFGDLARLATVRRPLRTPLSQKESNVMEAMSTGKTDGQIASHLGVSVPTVKTHVRSILRKTESRNRTQAIAAAFRRGLLS